jgi:hypothetical protein
MLERMISRVLLIVRCAALLSNVRARACVARVPAAPAGCAACSSVPEASWCRCRGEGERGEGRGGEGGVMAMDTITITKK